MQENRNETELCYIDEEQIVPNPLNHFSVEGIEEMAGSLRSYGIVTPLTVIGPYGDGTFRLIAGERRLTAFRKLLEEGELIFTISDNGLGMTEEQVNGLLKENTVHASSKRGSGIGVKNVNERIRLYFGEQYGLSIESEPDEGTTIWIHLPAIPYAEILEKEKK